MEQAPQRVLRILIANDHPLLYDGLRQMLSAVSTFEIIGQATSLPETIRMVGEHTPHVLLIDPHMQQQEHCDGLRVIEMIRGEWPQIAIVILTMQQQAEDLVRAMRAGVASYLTARVERATLLHALHAAARSETLLTAEAMHHLLAAHGVQRAAPDSTSMQSQLAEALSSERISVQPARQSASTYGQPLTEREREVLQRVARGERNKEIAQVLGISGPTVKTHLANIYFKLNVDSRTAAIATALEQGLITLVPLP